MTDYTVLAKFRNKEKVEYLIREIRKRGFTCYNFFDTPADPDKKGKSPDQQMESFEKVKDFYNNQYFKYIFEKDLRGLKGANKVIVLLLAGNSVHIEAGIAYGMRKELILIGEIEKPESLYLIFEKRYNTIEDFLKTI